MNRELTRIDTLDINLVESACRKEFKLDTSDERPGKEHGVGEKRLFIRSVKDAGPIDDFFQLDKVKYFFFLKQDLINYLDDARQEFFHPTQLYAQDLSGFFAELYFQTNNIDEDMVQLMFRSIHDDQNRYYLVLEGSRSKNNPNRIAYSYLNDICLPRLTKIYFVKLQDDISKDIYIYMLPSFTPLASESSEPATITINTDINVEDIEDRGYDLYEERISANGTYGRDQAKQAKYRNDLLMKMPCCAITGFSDDRILQACHIKPYSECNEDEQFDANNGVILTPTFHVLFERGFISFKDDGSLLISELMSDLNRQRLHIHEGQKCTINPNSSIYLDYHRNHLFKNIISSIQTYLE